MCLARALISIWTEAGCLSKIWRMYFRASISASSSAADDLLGLGGLGELLAIRITGKVSREGKEREGKGIRRYGCRSRNPWRCRRLSLVGYQPSILLDLVRYDVTVFYSTTSCLKLIPCTNSFTILFVNHVLTLWVMV